MATIVLAVAGRAIGGSIGAQIGSAIGGVIDRALFKPATREGARLSDLRVQTSSYGAEIPKLFGTMRVAGSVIWATDLIEHRATEGGGKGQASTTTYSYTASFAVALSARPILRVGRIWADGQLLRGAAGDLKVRTGFRLYTGSEDQQPDPLIAASEGSVLAPAHRGIAYAMFEDLDLTSFGNRIPQLTFEVIADAGPVTAGAVAASLGGVATEALDMVLTGFCAQGETIRASIDALCVAAGAWLRPEGEALVLAAGTGATRACKDGGVAQGDTRGERAARSIQAADATPRRLSLSYYDPARDYQAGVQQASRPGAGARETRIELPAVLDADAAKGVATAALARTTLGRERRTLTLGWEALDVRPGDRLTIADTPGQWRADRVALEQMVVKIECVRIAPAPLPAAASAGRSVAAPDVRQGSTLLLPFELPPLDDALASTPNLVVAAAGTESGWRRAALLCSSDGGATWAAAGTTAYPATLGLVAVAPGPGRAALIDRANIAEVTLAHAGLALANADMAALDAGANLAMLGDELLQFGRAEPLGGARWRLSELWRGRRGTEAAIGTQRPGDRFVLVTRDTLKPLDLTPAIGARVTLLAQGVEDSLDAAPVPLEVTGISVLPPSPVQLQAIRREGFLILRWTRRSRLGWRWQDGIDAPLCEEQERYQVEIDDGATTTTVTVDTPQLTLSPAPTQGIARVRQIGTHGLSAAAQLSLSATGDQA